LLAAGFDSPAARSCHQSMVGVESLKGDCLMLNKLAALVGLVMILITATTAQAAVNPAARVTLTLITVVLVVSTLAALDWGNTWYRAAHDALDSWKELADRITAHSKEEEMNHPWPHSWDKDIETGLISCVDCGIQYISPEQEMEELMADLDDYDQTCSKHPEVRFPIWGFCIPCEDESEEMSAIRDVCPDLAPPTDDDVPF